MYTSEVMDLTRNYEGLMVEMMELPILYNALFPVNDSSNVHMAPAPVVKASEGFQKQALLSAHQSDMSKFTSWLDYVDRATAKREKLSGKCSQGKGLLLRLRESVVEIPPRPPASLGTLRPIKLSELHLDRQHYGRVLYGTLCARPFKMTAVLTLLEECNTGKVVKLAVYNAVASAATVEEVQAQFPEGSRVAIKEPYFKRYKDRTVGLRVNNPGDVVFLESAVNRGGAPSDDKLRDDGGSDDKNELDYDQLRLEGNRAFASGDWRGAVNFYTRSIDKALTCPKCWRIDNSTCKSQDAAIISHAKEPQPCSKPDASNGPKTGCETQKRKSPSKKSSKKRSKQHKGSDQTQTPTSMKADLKVEVSLLAAYSNRSETWLRLHKYEEAVTDAENALQIDPAHVKSMFRRGRAYHCLQQYTKAVQCLQSAVKLSPHDADLEKALRESITADLQSRLGVYNLSSYYLSNLAGTPPNCADYVGPVTVQMLETKYGVGSGQRGLVTTSSVKAGDLLLVSSPLAIARVEGVEFHLVPETRRMNDASQEDLVTQLYNIARVAPRAFHQLQSLYNGGKQWMQPSMELFRPGSTFPQTKTSPLDLKTLGVAPAQPDITAIRNIVQWNAFDEQGFTKGGGWRSRGMMRSFCSGIWVLPSFINHSCLPNASRVHVGDAMMIHAAKDLEAGEEICLPYFDILSPLPQRREKGLAGWGFICKCPRCKLDESLQSEIHHMTDRYSDLEENAMPAIHQVPKGGSYMGEGFLKHTTKFLGLASEVEALLSTRKFSDFTSQMKNWVRASYAISYIVGNSTVPSFPQNVENAASSRLHFLSVVLESLAEVFPGNSQTLITATMVMEEVRKQQGLKSKAYRHAEERALAISRCIYGNQKTPVLRSLMKSLQEGLLEA